MRVGLTVTLAFDSDEEPVPPVGKVLSWTMNRYGSLEMLTVEWHDGQVVEYMAHEGCLRLLDGVR